MAKWGGGTGEKCRGCGKTVYPAEKLSMQSQIWHIDCLKCTECNKKLNGANWGGFIDPDGENKAYCSVHFNRLVMSQGASITSSAGSASSHLGEGGGHSGGSGGGESHHEESGGGESHHEESGGGESHHEESGGGESHHASSASSGAKPKWGGAPSEKCEKCAKTVYPAEKVVMQGQIWHSECLRCVECNKKLQGSNWGGFVPPENKPYCNVHHMKLVQAQGGATAFSGSTGAWVPRTSTTSSEGSGAKPRFGGGGADEKCTGCGKRCYQAEQMKMEGQLWHPNCLRCGECNKMLSGSNWGAFVPPDNKPLCKNHFNKLISATGDATKFSGSTTGSKWALSKD